MNEVRRAIRQLRRNPAFTVAATVVLALGIGASTAVFTVLRSVVLAPLPYDASDRLVWIESRVPGVGSDAVWGLSEAGYHHYLSESSSLAGLGTFTLADANLSSRQIGGTATRARTVYASRSLLDVLGARTVAGRLYTREEDLGERAGVALLSHDFWVDRHGADTAVVGRTVEMDTYPITIVGVLEPGLEPPGTDVDLWRPLGLDPAAAPVNAHYLSAVGRLEPGGEAGTAEAELLRLTSRFPELFPGAYSPAFMRESGFRPEVRPLHDHVVGSASDVLWLALGGVGILLLVAGANVAGLFLVRGESRRREMAIRRAMGARGGDLVRHLGVEGLVVALVAGAIGLAVAWLGIRVVLDMAPAGLPRSEEVGLGGWSVAFAALLSVGSGVLVGALPALRSAGGGSLDVRAGGGRGFTPDRTASRGWNVLVGAQMGLALVLLTGAVLLVRSFQELRSVDPGIEPRGVVAAQLSLPFPRYRGYESTARFHRDLARRLRARPGMDVVGATTRLPFSGASGCASVFVEGRPVPAGSNAPCVPAVLVTPGYFRAMGIPVRGEPPGWDDILARRAGVVVSQDLADRLWPGEDPIGQGLRPNGDEPPYFRVVGVAGQVRDRGLDRPPNEAIYYPPVPAEGTLLWMPPRQVDLVVRSDDAAPGAVVGEIRSLLAEADPEVAVGDVRTMSTLVQRSMARTTFTALVLGLAAAAALLLGAVGLYGVVSYVVRRRRREIGVRMALGARSGQVVRIVMERPVSVAALGAGGGLVVALASAPLLESFLFNVRPADPVTLASVAAVLFAVVLLATWLPARRATRVDPVTTLRAE